VFGLEDEHFNILSSISFDKWNGMKLIGLPLRMGIEDDRSG
jgi:hypothetical protein